MKLGTRTVSERADFNSALLARNGGHELFRREWALIAYCSGNSSCPQKRHRVLENGDTI